MASYKVCKFNMLFLSYNKKKREKSTLDSARIKIDSGFKYNNSINFSEFK